MQAQISKNKRQRVQSVNFKETKDKKQKIEDKEVVSESESKRLDSLLENLIQRAENAQNVEEIKKIEKKVYYALILWSVNKKFSEVENLLN